MRRMLQSWWIPKRLPTRQLDQRKVLLLQTLLVIELATSLLQVAATASYNHDVRSVHSITYVATVFDLVIVGMVLAAIRAGHVQRATVIFSLGLLPGLGVTFAQVGYFLPFVIPLVVSSLLGSRRLIGVVLLFSTAIIGAIGAVVWPPVYLTLYGWLIVAVPLAFFLERFQRDLRQTMQNLEDREHALAVLNVDLEQRVMARTQELSAANVTITRRAAARAQDVTDITHDTRHLLGAQISALALLRYDLDAENLPAEQHDLFKTVEQSAVELEDLFAHLLDAALLEANVLTLIPAENVHLDAVVDQVVSLLLPAFSLKHVALHRRPPPDGVSVPPICGDARRLARVIQNLLQNALRYTAAFRGDGTGQVTVTLVVEGDWLTLRVDDNGPGVSSEHLVHLTERFLRVVRDGNAPEGSGIGLNAVAGIVVLHGGEFKVHSEGYGYGFTALVRLPLLAAVSETLPGHTRTNRDLKVDKMEDTNVLS